jgi:putative endonuclease
MATAMSSKNKGSAAEDRALQALQQAGLTLIERNYRVARGPHARGGEIDLIMRDRDGTVVFVEVRARRIGAGDGLPGEHGGAAASVTRSKQARLVFAAQTWLCQLPKLPPCRFDVVAIEGDQCTWLPAAFDTSG